MRTVVETANGFDLNVDNVTYISYGCIDFGNNQFYEVFAPAVKPKDEDFVYHSYDVYLMSHDDGPEPENFESLTDFLSELISEQPHHLNNVIIQLGQIFGK